MWIKRILLIVPIAVLVFLALSAVWVPSNATVTKNKARAAGIVLYTGANPEDMNTWTATKTSDSDIYAYLFDGLITEDRMFEPIPQLAESVTVSHRVTLKVPEGATAEQTEAELRRLYGASVRTFERVSDAGEVRINLKDGKVLAKADQPAVGQVIFTIPTLPVVKVFMAPAVVKGKITSAVDPDIADKIAKWRGENKPYVSLDVDALTAEAMKLAQNDPEITKGKVKTMIAAAIKDLGDPVTHEQILDFQIRRGIHWVDGPFFKAEDLVDRETGKEKRHFGDEGGPWWCEGPELTSRDAKLTFDYVRDPDFASPRISSYTDIAETKIYPDDPYHFQVRYEQLYSPAIGDLEGALLPYHIWNRKAWTEEAIRRGKGPKDVGVPEAPDLGQWDEVPPGKYKPAKFLPALDREYSLRPSMISTFVLEPLNGNALPLWKNGAQIRLRRNEFYYDRKPEYQFLDYYVFDPNMGRETTEIVFMSGGVDAYGCKEYQVERYSKETDRYQVLRRQDLGYEYVAFNCEREQLREKNVRLALSFAINVEDIMKYVKYDQAKRINGPGTQILPWYNENHMITHKWRTDTKDKNGKVVARAGKTEQIKYLPYDPDEARAILFEQGFKDVNGKLVRDGKPLTINLINSTSPGARRSTALLAKEQWEKLGVDVDYKEFEWNVYISQYVRPHNYDVCVLGWSLGTDFDHRQLWHSEAAVPGGLNLAAYKSEKADKLMEKILTVFDPAEQVKMSHEIFDTIADDFPYVFLFSSIGTSVVDKHIVWRKEVGKNPDGSPILEDRPLNHEYLRTARQKLKFFHSELKRVDNLPDFKEEDYKR